MTASKIGRGSCRAACSLRARRLRFEPLEERQMLSISWNGAGDGTSWSDAANWSGGQVPTSTDDVVIDVAGSPTINIATDATVKSLTCQEALQITSVGLTVNGTSLVAGTLTAGSGTSLTATGTGVSFVASGATTIDGANLYAYGGATLSLPNVTTVDGGVSGGSWYAQGAQSEIDLSGLTNLTGGSAGWSYIWATSGGRVDLSQVASLDPRYIHVLATGTDSAVDLSLVTSLNPTGSYYGYLTAGDGGQIVSPLLTTFNRMYVSLDATGIMPTAQITSCTNGSLTVGQTADFSALANVEGANLSVTDGATLALPSLNTIDTGTGGYSWSAQGAGSVLDLTSLTSLADDSASWLDIQAIGGGRVDLSQVASFDPRYIEITASGENSVVDLSLVTSFNETESYYGYLTANGGGQIVLPLVTTLNRMYVSLDATGIMPTAQITALTNGSLTVGQTADFSALANIDGSNLTVTSGATLALPNVHASNVGAAGCSWYAQGAGSVLDLTTLTSLAGGSTSWLNIGATGGGRVDLSQVASIDPGYIQITASEENSAVDLSLVTSLDLTESYYGYLTAIYGGQIVSPLLTTLNGMHVSLDATGIMPTAQITALTNGALTVGQTADFSTLANVDGTSLNVTDGATLALPSVHAIGVGAGGYYWYAQGAGSVLDLSGLTSLAGGSGTWLHIQPSSGGRVNLSHVTSIGSGYLNVVVSGENSVVDLSLLTSFNAAEPYHGQLIANSGGRVVAPLLTTLNRMYVALDATGIMPTAQITALTNGSLTVGQTADFSLLANVDGSALSVTDGATLALPSVHAIGVGAGGYYWYAQGAGSVLDLSGLTSVTGGSGDSLYIQPSSGGRVNLSQVTSIDIGYVYVTASGENSVVDLSLLTNFNAAESYYGYLAASDGGHLLLGSGTVTLSRVSVTLDSTASLSAGTLQLGSETVLQASGTINAHVVNGGSVSVNYYPTGTLTINGDYTQTAAGTLSVKINGSSSAEADLFTVTGSATLDGTVAFTNTDGVYPAIGQDLLFLQAGTRSGEFSVYTGSPLGGDVKVMPLYGLTSVSAHTIPDAGPRVVCIVPSGTSSGTLTSIDVTFDEPTTSSSFTAADITLTGPWGTLATTEPTQISGYTYQFTLFLQVASGTYTLAIGPNVTDTTDNLMDQNANGTNGETTDAFSTAFVLATPSTARLGATLAADNAFDFYLSTDDTVLGTWIGSGDNYSMDYQFLTESLTTDSINYLHVVATDVGGAAGFAGIFELSDNRFHFTNGTGLLDTSEVARWSVSATGFGMDYVTPTLCDYTWGDSLLDGRAIWTNAGHDTEVTRYFSAMILSDVNIDADGNGSADALTDGILILRYLFDPPGSWNYSDALGAGATHTTREAIRGYLDDARLSVLDVDANGTADALTDGILILRYLFDPPGSWNYSDALGSGATRTTRAAIRAYLDLLVADLASSSLAAGSLESAPADETSSMVETSSVVQTESVTTVDSVSAAVEAAPDATPAVVENAETGSTSETPSVATADSEPELLAASVEPAGAPQAVDRVDLSTEVEQELGQLAVSSSEPVRAGLLRGIRVKEIDSLFAEENDPFDWR